MTKLTYDDSHWAREEDATKALAQYLAIGERPFNKTKQSLFMSLAGDVSGKNVLDYGGGAGYMAIPLAGAGANVTIVDAEQNGLRTARLYAQQTNVSDRIRTIHSQRVPDELKTAQFDVVIAKDIVEHIEDDQSFLIDLCACQKKGGVLLLSTQSSFSLNYLIEGSYNKYREGNLNWCGWDQTHLRFYTPSSLRHKLTAAGYKPQRWAGVYIIPYNIVKWLTLLKLDVEIPALRYFDLTLGRLFPFNRTGWNVLVRAVRER
jgi:2-polyprenyl-6-hydroxyphenyl methylase/3-demethylubiquinone-9 3-methyltransferase